MIKVGTSMPTRNRGNKNGTRGKLGFMPSQNTDNTLKMTEEIVDAVAQQMHSKEARTESNLAACHDFHKRKRNTPDVIHLHKNNLVVYKNCIQQNGRNFGFLPLNDLMVYTGVIWLMYLIL